MKVFANVVNGQFLRNVLPTNDVEIDEVRAAIAYGSDAETLVKNCLENHHKLDIWMRYDHTVPVTPNLLRKLISETANNISCYLIPDVHHAKIIWWKGYGAYIGSANLSDRAWTTNIEAGIFLTEEELEVNGELAEIEGFFDFISNLDESFPLTEEIIIEQEEMFRQRRKTSAEIDEAMKKKRSKPEWQGPAFHDRKSAVDTKLRNFLAEWEDGLTKLRSLAEMVSDYQPSWISPETPKSWQADQFLHAYYYNQVVDGLSHPFNAFHERNRSSPRDATIEALKWWAGLPEAPSEEDVNLTERAPTVRQILDQDYVRNMNLDDLERLLLSNHASRDHLIKLPASFLGLTTGESIPLEERVPLFGGWLLSCRNGRGQKFQELLHYILYEGKWQDTPRRLFEAQYDPQRKFQHIGINQLAEMVGWARPEHFPPRNGRTSKALRALGHNVRIY